MKFSAISTYDLPVPEFPMSINKALYFLQVSQNQGNRTRFLTFQFSRLHGSRLMGFSDW